MIKSFPVADRLHLLDLGGSRKFLQGFMNNKMVSFDRWTNFPIHYGRTHMSSNIHNLLHVHEDVEVHGELDNFSAYPFENFLQFLK
uniref:Uncharacterized protein n=1 Tax=Anopheles stephensi TaxID=30069 RepID=A0A182YMW0_ANOST